VGSTICKSCYFVVFLVLFASAGFAQGQDATLLLGPEVSYQFGVPLSINRTPGVINQYPFSGSGSAEDHRFGLAATMQLPELFTKRWGLWGALGYAYDRGSYTSDLFVDSSRALHQVTAQPYLALEQFTLLARQHLLTFELGTSYQLGSRYNVGVLAWATSRLSSSFHQIEDILGPDEAVFYGNLKQRSVATSEQIATGPTRFGFGISAGYRTTVSESVALQPSIQGRADLAALRDGLGIRAYAASVNLAVLFDLSLNKKHSSALTDITTTHPVDTRPMLIKPPVLQATVKFTADGLITNRVLDAPETQVLNRIVMPILPYLYDSAGLPTRYALTHSGVQGISPLEAIVKAYYETPAVLKARLEQDSTSKSAITVAYTGKTTSEVFAKELYAQLRNSVKDNERVKLEKQSSLYAPIELSSNAEKIMTPYIHEWIEESIKISSISFSKYIESEVGLRLWELTLRQDGRPIASYNSYNEFDSLEVPIDLKILRTNKKSILSAELLVRDAQDQEITAYDTLIFNVKSKTGHELHGATTFCFVDLPQYAKINQTMLKTIQKMTGIKRIEVKAASPSGTEQQTYSISQNIIETLAKVSSDLKNFQMSFVDDLFPFLDGNLPEHSLLNKMIVVSVYQ